MLHRLPLLVLAACLALPAAAQTPAVAGPGGAEAAVAALVAAQQAQDWAAAFDLTDPAVLHEGAEFVRGARDLFAHAVADSATVVLEPDYQERPQPEMFRAARLAAARLDSLVFYDDPSDVETVARLVGAVRSISLVAVYPESEYTPIRVDMESDSLARVVGRLDVLPGSSTPATTETTTARWTGTRWVVTFAWPDLGPVIDFVRFPMFNMTEILNAVLGDLFEGLGQ